MSMRKSTVVARSLMHPAALLQHKLEPEEHTVSASTEDPYNFVVDDHELRMPTITPRPFPISASKQVLWAEHRRKAGKQKEKLIDKLLKEEVRQQDREYRLQEAQENNARDIFDDKSQSDTANDHVISAKNPKSPEIKDQLRVRLQTEFTIGKADTQKSGQKTLSHRGPYSHRSPYSAEKSDFRRTQFGKTTTENSFSKKFRLISIDSRPQLRATINTERSFKAESEEQQDKEAKAKMRKTFAGDVVGSLQSGKSLNLNKYVLGKEGSKGTLELYLDVRGKDAAMNSRVIRKNSRPSDKDLRLTGDTRFEPSVTVSHLPPTLKLGMRTFNDFYMPDKAQADLEDEDLSAVNQTEANANQAEESTDERRKTLTYMIRAVKKVQQASTVIKAMKEVERMRLRERVEARKAEMSKYNDVLNQLEGMVLEKERQAIDAAERNQKMKEAAEQRRQMHLRYEMEQRKLELKRQKELNSKLNPKLLDPFSVRKATSSRPYKSYWMRCVEACLVSPHLFSDLPSKSEVDLNRSLHDGLAADTSEVGYYRVALAPKGRARKESGMEIEDTTAPWEKFEEYTNTKFLSEEPYVYHFEFDHLIEELNDQESPVKSQSSSRLRLNNSSPQDSRKSLHSITSKKRNKVVEQFSVMFTHVDEDLKREYAILFPEGFES